MLTPERLRGRFPEISTRETEVLGLIARGKSNDEIAAELFISVATVKSHVNSLFAKMPARDRAQAIALTLGTFSPDPDRTHGSATRVDLVGLRTADFRRTGAG